MNRLLRQYREIINSTVYIKVHVISESKEETVAEKEGILYVSVREKAERGAANRRMLELLRRHFDGAPPKHLKIVSGHHAPHKIISID